MVNIKICLVCSAGGHLLQLLTFRKIFKDYDYFFVTFKRQDTTELSKEEKVYFIKDPKRNPIRLLQNFFQSLFIFFKERPNVVMTTGAGVAIAICYIAKLFDSKIIFLEDFCRTIKPSLTGKLLYPISDLFLVQWKSLMNEYGDKTTFVGTVY